LPPSSTRAASKSGGKAGHRALMLLQSRAAQLRSTAASAEVGLAGAYLKNYAPKLDG
jgi:hypothetical protein